MDEKKKWKIFKFILICIVLITVLAVPLYAVMADNTGKIYLTRDEAIKRAGDYSSDIQKMYITVNTMKRNYNGLQIKENNLGTIKNDLDEYRQLYSKSQSTTLPDDEMQRLTELETLYGPVPPTMDQEFDIYIKDIDFTWYSLGKSIDYMNMNIESMKNTMGRTARELYDNILYMNDNLMLQQHMYSTGDKKLKALLLKYQDGKVSEIDKANAEADQEKLRLNIEITKRNIDNLMLQLKKQTGYEVSDDVELKDTDVTLNDKALLSCNNYIDEALANRSEIKKAFNDIDDKQHDLKITSDYYTSDSWRVISANDDVNQMAYTYMETQNSIKKDIRTGYADVLKKKRAVDIAKQKQNSCQANYDAALKKYEMNSISDAMLDDLETALIQSAINYKKAVRDYNNAVCDLELACGTGPQYVTQMGVSK